MEKKRVGSTGLEEKWLGRVAYDEALQIQNRLVAQRHTEVLLGLEHPLTITLGKRARVEDDLLLPPNELIADGIAIEFVERGGHATLHHPGQLVIYPILDLCARGLGVRQYVEILEKATQSFLMDLGVETFKKCDEPGLYTTRGKIAFFGIRVQRGWSSHGVSININNDLADFNLIVSCGRKCETFDKVAHHQTDGSLSLSDLFLKWCRAFKAHS